jgi:dihydroorotate dehydrogenase
LLFKFPPEQAQRIAEGTLALTPLWRAYGKTLEVRDPALGRTVAGIHLRNPIGLAAGFDKQCAYLGALGHLGFGYVVGGTVTYHPRPGNARPRLARIPERESLLNSLGFPSEGLQAAVARLRKLRHRPAPVLVSIAALEEGETVESLRQLEPLVEGVELNISSPNTAGLRRFQEPVALRGLLDKLNAARKKPLFVKLPPFVNDRERDLVLSLLNVCIQSGMTGVTAINTIPQESSQLAIGRGGLSGREILPDMLRIIPELRREAGDRLVIHACGGVATGEDAWRALRAGADTVQLYTAFVYRNE